MAATGHRPEVVHTPANRAALLTTPSTDRWMGSAVPLGASTNLPGFYARRVKRAFDLLVGVGLLLVLLPLFVGVAAAVLVMSGWPIFYGSERIGLKGRRFQMWKFRTMVRDADAALEQWKQTHPERAEQLLTHWKLEADPRVTALGRFLRKSSLDELPQFWNVLCGEMSIAGPRPYLSRESLEPDVARQIVSVRPGLTGPFQIRGRKGLSPQARMQLEAGYANDVTLLRDIGYIIRTLRPLMELDGH